MAAGCTYTYNGNEYTEKEFKALVLKGEFDAVLKDKFFKESISSQSNINNENSDSKGESKSSQESNAKESIRQESGSESGNGKNDVVPPKGGEPKSSSPDSENGVGIRHEDTADIRKENKIPEYEKGEADTIAKWDAEADKRIANGEMQSLIKKMERGENISDVEQRMMGKYIATLDAEFNKTPSKDNYEKLKSALDLSDKVGGSQWGKSGRARQGMFLPEDSMGTFLLDKELAQGYPLTETQIKEQERKYNELKKAKDDLEAELKIEREKNEILIAEEGLKKARQINRQQSKKTHEEYKKERADAIIAAREALKKIRTGQSGTTAVVLPGVRELAAITPHVKKYVESLLSEGFDKLDDIASKVYDEFKDVLPGTSKKDIIDIIGGVHDENKKTERQINEELRLLKREAKLLSDLQKERLGESSSKTDSEKSQKAKRIKELEDKIKEVRKLNKQKEKENEPVDDKTATDPEENKKLQEKLTKKIESLQKDLKEKNYAKEKPTPKPFVLTRKSQLLKDRVIQLEKQVAEERVKDLRSKMSKWERAWDKFQNALGIRRVVQTALDASIWFRQLGSLVFNPRKWDIAKKFIVAGSRSVFSQRNYDRYMDAIHKSRDFKESLEDGIRYNELDSVHPSQQNEFYPKSFIYKIPIVRSLITASQRIADSSLNVARYELYNKYKARLEKQGITRESDPEIYEAMAKLVMNSTGSGNLLSALENRKAEKLLGATFYGARLMAANFNTLNPLYYAKMPKEVRAEAMKDLAAYTTTIMATTLALAAMGGKVSLNPDDGDFLQVRFGEKVYDLTGGKAAYIRTFLRWVEAGYARVAKSKYEANKALEFAGKSTVSFWRNKFAPNTSYAINAYVGKNSIGQDFDPYEILKAYPMYADDAYKAAKEDGYISLLTVLLPNIMGVGYGSYYSEAKMKPIDEIIERNTRSDEINKDLIKNYKKGGIPITDKEFSEYSEKRDKEIEQYIKDLYEGTAPENKVLNEEGNVVTKKYNELDKDQIIEATSSIKRRATNKVKEDLFGKKKLTSEERQRANRLKAARKSSD